MSPLADFVTLSLAPFSWRRDLGDRLRSGEPPAAILSAIAPADVESRAMLERLPGLSRQALERATRTGTIPVSWADAAYPAALGSIYDPPPLLWLKGTATALTQPTVAIVGARAASPSALAVAEQLAGDLAAHGVVVVSGMARGVDSAAHRGALASGGATVAVLGSGVDVVYPPEHAALAASIVASGALVSELAPGTRPLQWFFPLRNRIISGLCRAVVVIEAGRKSGSLITAKCALEQGRDVLAVPGSVLGGRNQGGHALLRDGAKIVESADDILDELNLGRRCAAVNPRPGSQASQGQLSHTQGRVSDPILACLLPGEPFDMEAIAARTGLEPAHLLPRLLELELEGRVQRAGGGRFIRLDRSC
jgi:DNA processing protein